MKKLHHVRRATVLVVIAVALNVGVAWGLAAWRPFVPGSQVYAWLDDANLDRDRRWLVSSKATFGSDQVVAMARATPHDDVEPFEDVLPWSSDLPDYLHGRTAEGVPDPYFASVVIEEGRGWPLRCLRWRCDRGDREKTWRGGIELAPRNPQPAGSFNIDDMRALPLRPVFTGFAVNTAVYAAALWLVVFGPGALKRRLRRRRGACPWCGYPVGASAVCTECGGAVGAA